MRPWSNPERMPSSRLSLRLGQLPHDVLADLAARLCSESLALQAIADEWIAAHKQLPHELVEDVFLSPDLVPRILGPLGMDDAAAGGFSSPLPAARTLEFAGETPGENPAVRAMTDELGALRARLELQE